MNARSQTYHRLFVAARTLDSLCGFLRQAAAHAHGGGPGCHHAPYPYAYDRTHGHIHPHTHQHRNTDSLFDPHSHAHTNTLPHAYASAHQHTNRDANLNPDQYSDHHAHASAYARPTNHNIFVHVFDAKGNPLDGVVICRVYALQLQPPDPHACGISGETGPGRMHFDVYSGDFVFVASRDPEHRPLSANTRLLAQEPANMDFQELVDNGYCESIEDCRWRESINNLVRFHYSYEVHFNRRP
jgi:hypothetical protein